MRWISSLWRVHLLLVSICIFGAVGCNQEADEQEPNDDPPTQTSETQPNDGWWCAEHGIPENKCSMCDSAYATECREKGDWCDEHKRAMSNCFVCNPELEAEFAEDYEIRYGSPPPAMDPEAEHTHSHE